jgi:hypothetical protein
VCQLAVGEFLLIVYLQHLIFLSRSKQIHSQLQNSDFVHGISSIQKGATARYEQLLLYEMNGQSQVQLIAI